MSMGGFELKIWRRSLSWTQERAAEELGVSLRCYQGWEKDGCALVVDLATQHLSLRELWPGVASGLRKVSLIARH